MGSERVKMDRNGIGEKDVRRQGGVSGHIRLPFKGACFYSPSPYRDSDLFLSWSLRFQPGRTLT